MAGRFRNARLGMFLNICIGGFFVLAAVVVVVSVNYSMRQQALVEAQSKARIILDRNLATHTYFSRIMKPSIFAWSEPFRSKDYFDHTWMSSTYAIREIEKYFKALNPSGYSFKDSAVDARSPENEADEYERVFFENLKAGKKPEMESKVRIIDGKPYLVVLKKGEVMEASCLRCHSRPENAPKGMTDYYGSERSFNRQEGQLASIVSLRIPLSEAYAAANVFSWKLSAILLVVLVCLFSIQFWFYRRYLLVPLEIMRKKANEIAAQEGHLGEELPQPFGREIRELTSTFNEMSVKLRHDRDHLEELVQKRTEALQESEKRYHSLFENMLEGFAYCKMLYDGEGHPIDFIYLYVNVAFERLTGLRAVTGKKVTEAIPGVKESNPELLEIYGRVALTGNPERFEIDFKPLARLLSISVYSPEKGYFVAVFDDVTERKSYEDKLKQFAVHDQLTGLLNRRGLEDILSRSIAKAKRGVVSSLLYTDLDNFKDVNDTIGHSAGDDVLVILVDLLKAALRTEDIVFRLGGDEFAVLLDGIDGREALFAAERLRAAVEAHRFELQGRVFPLSLSIGVVRIDGTLALGELLSEADTAMYRAKAQGKNRVVAT
ncbi:MAG: diguanylate cyclase [Smithellaceae bacterium]|jgi:diguanylate cyclase (GGDEF)-like protein/PAS domain S-box-containing protein